MMNITGVKEATFDWQDLHEKTLKIYVGWDSADGVDTTCVLGVSEDGVTYILHTETKFIEEKAE